MNTRKKTEIIGWSALGGAFLNRVLSRSAQKKGGKPRATDMGLMVMAVSYFAPDGRAKLIAGGAAGGVVVDGLLQDYMGGTHFPKLPGLGLDQTDRKDPLAPYAKMYHIDPSLPISTKEALILPLLAREVRDLRHSKDTQNAIEEWKEYMGVRAPPLTSGDLRKAQLWFLSHGGYEADEGLWDGHDRFRGFRHLWTCFKETKGRWGERKFDCDDVGFAVNQLLAHHGLHGIFIFISQKPDGSLHHVLPGAKIAGRWMAIEGIPFRKRDGKFDYTPRPWVPISELRTLFPNLTRVAIVPTWGKAVENYQGWR